MEIYDIDMLTGIIVLVASYLIAHFGYYCSKRRLKKLIQTIIGATSDKKITLRELYEIGRQVLLAFGYEIRYTRPPEIYTTISSRQLARRLRNSLGEIRDLRLADSEYTATTKEQLMTFLKADLTNLRQYQPEIFDCDDFAAVLYGNVKSIAGNLAFGFAWVNWQDEKGRTIAHAVNVAYLVNENKVYFIEPQNDSIFEKPQDWYIDLLVM